VELDCARIAGRSEGSEGCRIAGILVQPEPLMAIENVEDLRAKLQTYAFRQAEILLYGDVFGSTRRNRAH
jgi:hypothetical protein